MEQVQVGYWAMDIWKVNEFGFQMKKFRNLQIGGVGTC